MGYETEYKLVVFGKSVDPAVFALGEPDIDFEQVISGRIDYNPFEERCKWYEHETDLKAVSKEHPARLFMLCGVGESGADLWVKYFRAGKICVARARIEFDLPPQDWIVPGFVPHFVISR